MAQTVVNSATFTFTRTSSQGELPLISVLNINSTNINLNGTVVQCMEGGNMMTSALTTIQIIDTSQSELLISILILTFIQIQYRHPIHSNTEQYYKRI